MVKSPTATPQATVRRRVTAGTDDFRDRKTKLPLSKSADREPHFHWDIWLVLAVENWIFDFGRPIAALFVPVGWSPLDRPSIGDYFHMAYNVITPFCLLKLQERSKRHLSSSVTYLSVITFVMGASIHLVGDSVNHRLQHFGYLNHLSVAENPLMKQLRPPELYVSYMLTGTGQDIIRSRRLKWTRIIITFFRGYSSRWAGMALYDGPKLFGVLIQSVKSFQLLYVYDEEIGHYMWYVPFFLSLFLHYTGCFQPRKRLAARYTLSWWLLLVVSATYYWYLVTEGQIYPLFLAVYIGMLACGVWQVKVNSAWPDINGAFIFLTFTLTLALTQVWAVWLWDDPVLRQKYQGLLYMPEPWAYYTLYLANH